MTHSELIKEYIIDEAIPYNLQLNTIEWKNKRENIIKRDGFCCTRCDSTQSFLKNDFNVQFRLRQKLNSNSIVYENKPIELIKKELNIKNITIVEIPFDNSFCGISDNGILFLVNSDILKNTPKNELVINRCESEKGERFYVFGQKNCKYSNLEYFIPQISTDRVILHVHHTFYVKDKLAWDYNDDDLITLCNKCHTEVHDQIVIPWYEIIGGELRKLPYRPCKRCNGIGYFPEYKNVEDGVCFRCKGKRYEELIESNSEDYIVL
ncbi:HNH endonuclease [Flavobacterium sp.]|uniref:HNH endonuclease n=1 Tax=Flavobacterium sp. TaxID=239 RepID=UPI002623443F|nr:HNH endonuclease [Flavobacterium sp.]MDD3005871.1 HNH endonuclease [Flavobacterium sp.]